ncbi:MAG TPA: hypothetical protein VMW64_01370 [Dehalococcoidia bacterium]|nr:hypothetical protein [Dehalococcoidia bacterium]
MQKEPANLYFWISRLAGFVGIVCIIIGIITAVLDDVWVALPATYVQLGIAAFLFAIWAVLYELRDRGIKTK